jgi:hypothetical protein
MPMTARIVNSDGSTDSVHIAAKSKVFLSKGWKLDKAWSMQNPKVKESK